MSNEKLTSWNRKPMYWPLPDDYELRSAIGSARVHLHLLTRTANSTSLPCLAGNLA